MITVFPVPVLRDNYTWILQAADGACAVVDPGESAPVRAALRERGLTPEAIIVTHHHPDHQGGVADLVTEYPVPVYGPAAESIAHRTHPLRDGDVVDLPATGLALGVLETPGHTAGHISLYGEGILLSGDTLFAGGCGRLFEGTPEQMYASLEKLAQLPETTRVYCGHEYTEANLRFASQVEPGNDTLRQRLATVQQLRAQGACTLPSTLADEFATNPFLRCGVEAVKQSAEAWAGKRFHTPQEVFSGVRAWKDAS